MNTFFKLTALAGLLAIAGHAFAVDDITRVDQIPVLKEEPQHATVSERVTSRFTRSHYRQFDLDQAFSAKIFDRYLNLLDYSHNVLLASDVAQFADKKQSLDDELKSGQLDTPFALFNLAQKRRFERYQYALSVLRFASTNFVINVIKSVSYASAVTPVEGTAATPFKIPAGVTSV